jgi:hypothetical protein
MENFMNKLLVSLIFLSVTQAYSMERLPEGVAQFAQRRNDCIEALNNARLGQDQEAIEAAIEILRDLQADLQAFKAQSVMNNRVQKQCQIMINAIDAAITANHHVNNNDEIAQQPRKKLFAAYAGQEEPDSLMPVSAA